MLGSDAYRFGDGKDGLIAALTDTCHSEKCREWNINFLADPLF